MRHVALFFDIATNKKYVICFEFIFLNLLFELFKFTTPNFREFQEFWKKTLIGSGAGTIESYTKRNKKKNIISGKLILRNIH